MAAATSTACPFSADSEMAATYAPAAVEKNWYGWWKNQGYFRPKSDADPSDKSEPFVIVLPPPNVTGKLHLGHALTASVQDSIVRFNRMKGRNTLYLPGTDHAGIATQVVVEKRLQAKEGKSRHDLGREEFLKKVWEFKHEHSNFIHDQLQLLGSSLDHTRDRFTLDDQCAAAVKEAFVRFHEDGIMYRATRLVNWCCALQSAISDLEVEQVDTEAKSKTTVPNYAKKVDMGMLTHVAYKVVGEDAELVVATTRPETILGDTAIAVHPEDPRYTQFHGKFVQCPFRDAQIPIVCDPILVDKEFGTGVVKITPAHDFNDYEAGVRNKLPMISVLDQTGHITMAGQFQGMHRFDARTAIVAELEKLGLLRGQEGHAHRVPRCSRTNDIVEPLLMPQWFLDCSSMAKRSLDAVEKGELKLTPEYHITTWRHFLGEIKPWCVSRQLWWGHRIPAYVVVLNGVPVKGDDSWVVARTEAEAREKAMKQFNLTAEQAAQVELQQDPDVLDTWFSSGLWPFSTMGWPNEAAPDMTRFFPGNLLETGHDILFFWVARMVMMSLHLTNKLPFSEVYLHAMVRDKDGRKMSKALGNVIDPLDVIYGIALQDLHDKLQHGNLDAREIPKAIKFQKEAFPEGIPECGSDALRFGLLSYTQSGRNVNLDIERIVGYRQFGNKLWNATRYILFHALPKGFTPVPLNLADRASLPLECRWILSRLDLAAAECNQGFSEGTYDFAMTTTAVYRFWLYELCDVFLELTKPVMAVEGERKTLTQSVLLHAVETGLRLLHPMMPFITEELYHRLPHHAALPSESIMVAEYPQPAGWRDAAAEADMALVQEVVHTVRSMKAQYALTPKVKPEVWIACNSAATLATLAPQHALVETLGGCGATVAIAKEAEATTVPVGCGFQTATPEVGVHMMLKGFISVEKEVAKLAKAIAEKQKILDGHRKKMQIPNYDTKVPQAVRDANTEKENNLVMELANLAEAKVRMEQLQ